MTTESGTDSGSDSSRYPFGVGGAVDRLPVPAVVSGPGGEDGPLSVDLVHELLKNERRRFVLDHLERAEGPVTMRDLSEAIAARENDKPVAAVTAAERKRVYVGLHQSHLPKLAEAGVVEFDEERDRISLGEHAGALDRYRPETADRIPEGPYILLSALSLLLLVASLLVGSVAGTSLALVGLALVSLLLPTVVAIRLRRRR